MNFKINVNFCSLFISLFIVMLEGIDSGVRGGGHNRHGPLVRHKYTGFMLTVERKSNETNRLTEVSKCSIIIKPILILIMYLMDLFVFQIKGFL